MSKPHQNSLNLSKSLFGTNIDLGITDKTIEFVTINVAIEYIESLSNILKGKWNGLLFIGTPNRRSEIYFVCYY